MNRFRYWLYERLMSLAFRVYPAQKEQELDQESLEWLNLYTNPPENGCECDICRDLKTEEERLSQVKGNETISSLKAEDPKPISTLFVMPTELVQDAPKENFVSGNISLSGDAFISTGNPFAGSLPKLKKDPPRAKKYKATTTKKKKVAKKTVKKSPLRPVRIK